MILDVSRSLHRGFLVVDIHIFVPFPDFVWSARCLDDIRLDTMRHDVYEIMRALLTNEGLVDSPYASMWRGHERALLAYQQAICNEWINERGNEDTYWDKTRLLFLEHIPYPLSKPLILPYWLGNTDFHISHQSNLLRMDESHYCSWFPGIKNNHEYVWPKDLNKEKTDVDA